MTQTFPAVAEAEIGCGGESGFLSHACSGVGVGAPGCPGLCGKKVWEQPECVCISWVIDDAGEQAVFP